MIPAENMVGGGGYRKAITTYFQYEVAIKVVHRFISRTNSSVLAQKLLVIVKSFCKIRSWENVIQIYVENVVMKVSGSLVDKFLRNILEIIF